jgi:TRAP-type C4-dicarboxylate transport system permease small subunit
MRGLVRRTTHVLEALTLVGMSVVCLTIMVEVILRYGFGSSLIFTEELSRYTMVWVAFLGGVVALRDGAHVATGGLGDRFGATTGRIAAAVADGLSLVFLGVVAWAGVQTLPNQMDQYTTTLNVSIVWFYLAIPVGAVLMALVIIGRRLGVIEPAASELPVGDL